MTTWLALDGARVAAYLLESRATNKPGLLEAAGEQVAIAGLVRHVLDRLERRARPSTCRPGFAPDGLPRTVTPPCADRTPAAYGGNMMLRLNDPAAFLRGIRGWLAAHPPRGPARRSRSASWTPARPCRSSGERSDSRSGRASCGTTSRSRRRELTSVLFGPHADRPVDVPAALAWLPRFRVPIPVLDRS